MAEGFSCPLTLLRRNTTLDNSNTYGIYRYKGPYLPIYAYFAQILHDTELNIQSKSKNFSSVYYLSELFSCDAIFYDLNAEQFKIIIWIR